MADLLEMCENYAIMEWIFTDGLNPEIVVGATAVWGKNASSEAMLREAFVYTAKVHAIFLASETVKGNSSKDVIF